MRTGITIEVSREDRCRLVGDRNSQQKHVWRARINASPSGGTDGLLRDKTRPLGTPPPDGAAVDVSWN